MDQQAVEIVDTSAVGPSTVALELETPPSFVAAPGQFVLVRATVDGEDRARHYTISSPDVEGTFEITVGIDPEGDLSPWLGERSAGERLTIEGPFGTVAYEGGSDVVVLAGGPGVGPAVGVAERADREGHRATVVYRDEGVVHGDRLEAIEAGGGDVVQLDPGDGLAGPVERVQDRGTVFVFGFRDFVDEAVEAIDAAGGDPDDAMVENFG